VIRVLFADDEPMARKRLRRLLSAIEGVEIVAECENGEAALRELDRMDVDLALLDVRMGAASGLVVADAASALGVEVIFTTAHAEHAVAAFEKGAVDYVLKPVEEERLRAAVSRAVQRIDAVRVTPSKAAPLDRVALEVRGEVRLVRPDDVSHALLDGELVTVFVGAEALLTERTLAELSAQLGPRFVRVHRRALLDLAHVERLRPEASGGYTAITRAGLEVPVSRQAARALRRQLGLT
jgi:two-component system LytT family response regulator